MARPSFWCAASLSAAITLQACDRPTTDEELPDRIAISQHRSATILLDAGYSGNWSTGLDPATNLTARANLNQMNAIYGGLFQLVVGEDGEPTIVGVLAHSYAISDDGTVISIHLREGMVFSDGTPFNSEAVRVNIERSLASPCTCAPTAWPWSDESRVTTDGDYVVRLHFRLPYPPAMHAFPVSNVNWIASPSALASMGEQEFRLRPVGAGPFKVVSNQLSTTLVLERNPLYFENDRPFLDEIIFRSIGNEQAALQALLSGDAHAYLGLSSVPLLRLAEQDSTITVTQQPGTAPYVIQLNTTKPPFDDQRAREAIYYATDVQSILSGIFNDAYPISESFTGPGGLFYQPRIPGYRRYDPDRARELVNDLGGLVVTLGTLETFVAEQIVTALESQWESVGVDVTITTYELPSMIDKYLSGDWSSMLQTAGSYDPESSGGVSFRFRSDQPYSGVEDLELDRLLIQAAAALKPSERATLYSQAAQHINDRAYAPFLFAFGPAQLTIDGLSGPGLTTAIPPIVVNTGVLWQHVKYEGNE